MNGDLNAIADNVVTGLDIYTINDAGDQLQVTGQALTELEVMQYVRKLQDTGRFSEVTIASLVRLVDTEKGTEFMSYSLALKLKEG
jgi:hypothetical protein